MANSKGSAVVSKPHPDFPLTPRRSDGRWQKKIRGEVHYFTGSAQEALDEWLRVKDDLLAGRRARAKSDELTVRELCERFLQAKELQRDAGELRPLSWSDYKKSCKRVLEEFGATRPVNDLRSEDFESLKRTLSKTRGPVALGNEIQRVRVLFKYAFDAGLISSPIRYGPLFKRPSRKVLRIQRAKQGRKFFEAAAIRQMLDKATPQLKAMILLGINAGFGNNDCATLPLRAINWSAGTIDFPRPKTGIARRVTLWPETIKALKTVLAKRRTPKDKAHAELVFVTAARGSFAKDTTDSPITKEFAKLVNDLGLKQTGRGFLSLRHTFRTVASGARDLEATRYLMGHVNEHVEDAYIERVEDERLKAVTSFVRNWLVPAPVKTKQPAKTKTKKRAAKSLRKNADRDVDAPLLRVVR
jgi:integrase